MLKVKPFLFILCLTVFVALFTTACSDTGSSSSGGIYDNTTNPGGGDTENPDNPGGGDVDKPGVTPVNEFPANPLALLGIYNVTSQSVDGTTQEVAAGSEFRVNVDTKRLLQQYVDVLVRIKVNGKTIDFQREVSLAGNTIGSDFFEKIFTEMGAKVTGKYTLEFTLDSVAYNELVKEGIITDGQTLVISLDKTKDLAMDGGLDDETSTDPEEPVTVPVESVTIKGQQPVVHGGASFKLTAEVLPSDATNKVVTWSSSHPDYISVDNQGNVTIKGYTTETITITAVSSADNTKTASWQFNIEKAAITGISVTPADMTLTLKKDGSAVSANITTAIEPAIATDYTTVNYAVTSGQDFIKVDANGVVTAVAEGSAVVTVTVGNLTKTVNVTVNPAPDVEIPVENITVTNSADKVYKKGTNVTINFTLTPATTTDTMVSYTTQSSSGNLTTANGNGSFELTNVQGGETVTFTTAKGQQATYTINAVDGIDVISFVNETIKVDQNQTGSNELNNKDAIQNSSASITYESLNPDLASVDSSTGVVTGLKNGLATIRVSVQPKYESAPIPAEFKVDVLGNIDWADENSLQGTYNIVFFGTNTNNSSLAKAVISNDCTLYNDFKWNNSFKCPEGTGGYAIPEGDFVGRALVRVENGVVTINTKVGFIGNGTIQNMSPADQYQYTNYPSDSLSSYINTSNVGTLTGRHLTEKTTSNDATYYLERDVNYTGMTNKDIVLFTKITKEVDAIFTTITVYPDTRLVLRKISSQIIPMSPNTLAESPFDVLQSKLTLEADANIDATIN